jgi:hypothetical protein
MFDPGSPSFYTASRLSLSATPKHLRFSSNQTLDPTLHRQFAYYIIPTHRSFVSTVQSAILLYCFIYIFYTIIIIVIYFGEKNQFLLVCLSEHLFFL